MPPELNGEHNPLFTTLNVKLRVTIDQPAP